MMNSNQCQQGSLLFEHLQLSANYFDPRFNKEWSLTGPQFSIKGPIDDQIKYFYPRGWKGYALEVKGKYDEGNDDWLQINSNSNQWIIMYIGVMPKNIKSILENGFQVGRNQAYSNIIDIRKKELVGAGIYLSNHTEVCESYAAPLQINNTTCKAIIQVRVRPQSLKQIKKSSDINSKMGSQDWDNDYFVVNKPDDIRPYRILVKEENQDFNKANGKSDGLDQNGRCQIF